MGFDEILSRRPGDRDRARSEDELKKVLDIIRATEGVKQVKPFVDIKPLPKTG